MLRLCGKVLGALCSLPVGCLAQQVWVVDAAGGPGVQFTDVQSAVFAAASGDRIEVHGPASYSGFAVDRGVVIEGQPGVTVSSIVFVGLPAGQHAAARGFAVTTQVLVADCAGEVVLQDLTMTTPQPLVALKLSNSSAVRCRDVQIGWDSVFVYLLQTAPAVRLDHSAAVFEQCDVVAVRGTWFGMTGGAALHVDAASTAIVVGGSLTGGFGEAAQDQGPGIGCVGPGRAGSAIDGDGTVVVLGGATLQPGGVQPGSFGCSGGIAVPTVASTAVASVTIDPSCIVAPACGGCASVSIATLGTPPYAQLGSTATIEAIGTPGDLVALAGDFVQGFAAVPGFHVPWVLSAAPVLLDALVLSASGTATHALAVPAQPALAHLDLYFQGVAWSQGSLQTTGPTMLHTR